MTVAEGTPIELSPPDLEEVERRGMTAGEIQRQVELLRNPPAPVRLDRPCTVGDGIHTASTEDIEQRTPLFEAAALAGRWRKKIPASGAASRMFQPLLQALNAARETDLPGEMDVLTFASRLQDFAFWWTLTAETRHRLEALQRARKFDALLEALLPTLMELPKGLLPFHTLAGEKGPEVRSPLEEHLVEGARLVRDAEGLCRLHFTVSPDHQHAFEKRRQELLPTLEARFGTRFEVTFSTQSLATDTVALDEKGALVHHDGGLLFRPGGHGSLIGNLNQLAAEGADLVLIKNIDNVQPEHDSALTLQWKKILGGTLVALQERAFDLLRRYHDGEGGKGGWYEEAAALLKGSFGRDAAPSPEGVAEQLHRPLRVCGVVANEGEPGGGPFWVHTPQGITPQIVEGAQIDSTSQEQREILAGATHFNPVDLACGVRDVRGEPFDLTAFVDPLTAFVAEKNHAGTPLMALERPGLWNGAMAFWNTYFLEVPAATFTPVKTVLDLLRPEHRPPATADRFSDQYSDR